MGSDSNVKGELSRGHDLFKILVSTARAHVSEEKTRIQQGEYLVKSTPQQPVEEPPPAIDLTTLLDGIDCSRCRELTTTSTKVPSPKTQLTIALPSQRLSPIKPREPSILERSLHHSPRRYIPHPTPTIFPSHHPPQTPPPPQSPHSPFPTSTPTLFPNNPQIPPFPTRLWRRVKYFSPHGD